MHHFHMRSGVLHAEDVNVQQLAAQLGTPLYIYSSATMTRHVRVFFESFAPRKIGVHYAVKANGNLAVLKTLHEAGAGADVVSQGEIRKCLAAGIPASKIIYSGVGKDDDDLTFAVNAGLHQINVETEGELLRLSKIAAGLGKNASIALRINPAIGAGGHAKITTGGEDNKFGISLADAERLYAHAQNLPGIKAVGLAMHIGSQIFDLTPLRDAYTCLRQLAERLRAKGFEVARLDLGGGLGISYDVDPNDGAHRVKVYADMVEQVMEGFDVELSFEPGRLIVANAGILVTKVIGDNPRPAKNFVIVDAGMNDLLRPALYDAHHALWPVVEHNTALRSCEVAGPICESSDHFGSYDLPQLSYGDLLAFMSAGAYGSAMSSNYNLRPLAAEVLVDGANWALVRPRQSYEQMLGADNLAIWKS